MNLKPSLNWLLIFVPVVIVLRYWPGLENETAAMTSTASLTLAAIALLIPTVFHLTARTTPTGWDAQTEQQLSLAIAVVLFVSYLCLLAFSLITHKHLFNDIPEATEIVGDLATAGDAPLTPSLTRSAIMLLVATAFVALVSEFLVGAVAGARTQLGVTEVFVGIIVVAIVGNAAEHSTAILMAMKNKMDLSLGIAIGSSLQIALFVAPLLLFLSYFLGQQPMSLEFTVPEVVAVIVSVIVVGQISSDGESNWFEGVQLLAVYLILAILFFYLPALV